jgi:hypothetical protein
MAARGKSKVRLAKVRWNFMALVERPENRRADIDKQ